MDPNVVNIKLMADIADLQSKMQAAKALMGDTMKGITDSVSNASRALGSVMGVLGGLGAGLSVAAMVSHARATIDAADAMKDLSQRTGIAVQDLAKYQLATSQSGTTMEALAKGVKGVAANLLEHGDALKRAGITATTADDAMKQFADVFSRMPDSIEKTNLAVKVFGKSGMDLIPMLNMGSKGLEEAAAKSAKYAAQMAAMAPLADAFNDNMAELSMHSKVAGMNMMNSMLPALVSISSAMAEAAKNGGLLKGIVAGIQTLFTGDDLHKANVATVKGLELVMAAEKALEIARAAGDTARIARLENTVKLRQSELETHRNYRKMLEDEQEKKSPTSQAPENSPTANWMADYKKIMAAIGGDETAKKAAADLARVREEQARLIAELGGLSGSFAKDWENLAALFKNGSLKMSDLEQAQAKLLSKQPAIKEAAEAETKAAKEVTDANLAAAAARWKYLESIKLGLDKAQAEVTAMEEQTARIGLSKEAIAALDAAKLDLAATELERQAIRAYDKNLDDAEYASLMKTAKAYRELGKAKQVNAQTETTVTEFNRVWESIDRTAHDTFVNIFQGGQDAFTKLRDTLKATLLDMLYQMTVKKWIVQIQAQTSSTGTAGTGATGATGVLSKLGLPAGVTDFFGSVGKLVGTWAPVLGAVSFIKDAMAYKITPTGNALTADFKSGGVNSVGTLSTFHQSGGFLGGGETDNGQWGVADSGTTGYINQQVLAVTAANKAYASAIGLNASAIDGYTQSVVINTTGMDEAATKAAIDAAALKFQTDQAAAAYGDALKSVALDGETTAQTMQRLATDLTGANQVMAVLGYTLYDVSTAGAAAASGLVQAMGGLAQFQSQMNAYYQGYYSQEEQKANVVANAQSDLTAAGITGFTNEQISGASREQIRAVVEAYAANKDTVEGAAQFAAVVKVANQLSAVTPALNAAAEVPAEMVQAVKENSSSGGGGGGGGSRGNAATSDLQKAIEALADTMRDLRSDIIQAGPDSFAQLKAQFAIQAAMADSGDLTAMQDLPELARALAEVGKSNTRDRQEQSMLTGYIIDTLARVGTLSTGGSMLSVPGFAIGTDYVPRDMLAMIHEGERITPKPFNPAAGYTANAGDDAVATAIASLGTRLGKIEENTKFNEKLYDLLLPAMQNVDSLQVAVVTP